MANSIVKFIHFYLILQKGYLRKNLIEIKRKFYSNKFDFPLEDATFLLIFLFSSTFKFILAHFCSTLLNFICILDLIHDE